MKKLMTVLVILGAAVLFFNPNAFSQTAKGTVFEDANKNLMLDKGEIGIPGVLVSNQRDVVQTDGNGRYTIRLDGDAVIFITKPAGYQTPMNEVNLPQFYYIHQPKGSPKLEFGGVQPTGNLPKQVNFPLFKSQEPDTFSVLAFADPQTRDNDEISYLRDDVVAELIRSDALCGITLGDIMYDDLSHYPRYNRVMAQLGIPLYNVPGNHDENYDAASDEYSMETFKRHFGPNYYSFDYGQVHFIVLDDVEYLGKNESGQPRYQGRIVEKQLTWLENDLRFVPSDKLIVLTKHIPIFSGQGTEPGINVTNREALFDILAGRKNILALAGHMHTLEHHFLGETLGWHGEKPIHEIICSAAAGAWWSGQKDERGIPVTDQSDGTPNGYHVIRFAANQYTQYFKAASRGADYQMRFASPLGIIAKSALDTTQIIVNIFDGSEKSTATCSIDDQPAQPMQRVIRIDPFIHQSYQQQKASMPYWLDAGYSTHIWSVALPTDLAPGPHHIVVRTVDQYGVTHQAAHIFEVE
ncbi:MAG: calcineurin-like phosphoesterase C-terminal domain-containing protein [Candidatus Zhuqueibacterota bacterium]